METYKISQKSRAGGGRSFADFAHPSRAKYGEGGGAKTRRATREKTFDLALRWLFAVILVTGLIPANALPTLAYAEDGDATGYSIAIETDKQEYTSGDSIVVQFKVGETGLGTNMAAGLGYWDEFTYEITNSKNEDFSSYFTLDSLTASEYAEGYSDLSDKSIYCTNGFDSSSHPGGIQYDQGSEGYFFFFGTNDETVPVNTVLCSIVFISSENLPSDKYELTINDAFISDYSTFCACEDESICQSVHTLFTVGGNVESVTSTIKYSGYNNKEIEIPDYSTATAGNNFTLPKCPESEIEISDGGTNLYFVGWSFNDQTYQPGDKIVIPAADEPGTVEVTAVYKPGSEISSTLTCKVFVNYYSDNSKQYVLTQKGYATYDGYVDKVVDLADLNFVNDGYITVNNTTYKIISWQDSSNSDIDISNGVVLEYGGTEVNVICCNVGSVRVSTNSSTYGTASFDKNQSSNTLLAQEACGKQITIYTTPKNTYEVSSITITFSETTETGDKTTEVPWQEGTEENSYTFTIPDTDKKWSINISVVFEKSTTFTNSLTFDSYFSTVTHDGSQVNPWDVIDLSSKSGEALNYTFSVAADEGYSVKDVTCTDQTKLTRNQDGTFTVCVEGNLGISVSVEPASQQTADYVLYTADDLFAFAQDVNNGNTYEGKIVRLGCDIDLDGREWTPIGYAAEQGTNYIEGTYVLQGTHEFKGTFDGAGYSISGLSITPALGDSAQMTQDEYTELVANGTNVDELALFGATNGATVKNLTVSGSILARAYKDLVQGQEGWTKRIYAAGIVAYNTNTDIINCTNNVNITAYDDAYIGGICAYTYYTQDSQISISNVTWDVAHYTGPGIYGCVNKGSIKNPADWETSDSSCYIAGIAAYIPTTGQTLVAHCTNYGDIESTAAVKVCGITDLNDYNADNYRNAYVDRCANYGNITLKGGSSTTTGGYVSGITDGANRASVTNCVNFGAITNAGAGKSVNVYGVSGGCRKDGTHGTVADCVNYGTLSNACSSGYTGAVVNFGNSNYYPTYNNYNATSGAVDASQAGGAFVNTTVGEGEDATTRVALASAPASVAVSGVASKDGAEGSATISFAAATGASFEVSQTTYDENGTPSTVTFTPNDDGVFTLQPGDYSVRASCEGYFDGTRTFSVFAGEVNTIIVPMTKAAVVGFELTPASIASVRVYDAAGSEVAARADGKFELVAGATYTYVASAPNCATVSAGFKAEDGATVVAEPLSGSTRVAFNVTAADGTELSGVSITVKKGSATYGPADGTTYILSAGDTFAYTITADNFDTVRGEVLAGADQTIDVVMDRTQVLTTLQATSVDASFVVTDAAGEVVLPYWKPAGNTVEGAASSDTDRYVGYMYTLGSGLTYNYVATAPGYVQTSGSFVAGASTIAIKLDAQTVDVALNVSAADAPAAGEDGADTFTFTPRVSVVRVDGTEASVVGEGGAYSFAANDGATYRYTVSADGYTTATGLVVAGEGASVDVVLSPVASGYGVQTISGSTTISAGGTYRLAKGATGVIEISTTEPVTIVGTGVSAADKFSDLQIKGTIAGVHVVLQDLYIQSNIGQGTAQGQTVNEGVNIVDVTGTGNTLDFAGTVLLEQQEYVKAAGIHVAKGSELVIGGGEVSKDSTLYMYKYSQGSGIGGNTDEACGRIEFAGGNIFIKGSKTGAVIGGDYLQGTSGDGDVKNDDIVFSGGNVNLINKAGGAAVGASKQGSCAGDVYVTGGNVTIITDYAGAGIGYGANGQAANSTLEPGNLYVTGGSLKTVSTLNARTSNGNSRLDGQMVDSSMISADLGGESGDLALFVYDTGATGNTAYVFAAGSDEPVYIATSAQNYYYSETTTSTLNNWTPLTDTNVYMYLDPTGGQYTVKCEGQADLTVAYDETSDAWVEVVDAGEISVEGEATLGLGIVSDQATGVVSYGTTDVAYTLGEGMTDVSMSVSDPDVADVTLDKDRGTVAVTAKKVGIVQITLSATGPYKFASEPAVITVAVAGIDFLGGSLRMDNGTTDAAGTPVVSTDYTKTSLRLGYNITFPAALKNGEGEEVVSVTDAAWSWQYGLAADALNYSRTGINYEMVDGGAILDGDTANTNLVFANVTSGNYTSALFAQLGLSANIGGAPVSWTGNVNSRSVAEVAGFVAQSQTDSGIAKQYATGILDAIPATQKELWTDTH